MTALTVDRGTASEAVSDSLAVLMARHRITTRPQKAMLSDLVGLSVAAFYNRLKGTAEWSVNETQRIAELFGQTVLALCNGPALLDLTASPSPELGPILALGRFRPVRNRPHKKVINNNPLPKLSRSLAA